MAFLLAHGTRRVLLMFAAAAFAAPMLASGGTATAEGKAIPAFPGAQGFGTDTRGGRGGRVHVVTTLDWSGAGSFSEALFARGPRIIVFEVSGVIEVPTRTPLLTREHAHVTVAGQSSPGGITLRGGGTALRSYRSDFHDGVFRFLRFRAHDAADNVSFNTSHHVVFDHCDFSGGTDEALDITFSRDFTVQWSTIANSGPGGQRYGALFAYAPSTRISFHHNLSAHHAGRCAPHLHWSGGPVQGGAQYDLRNNVLYNCGHSRLMHLHTKGAGTVYLDMVGNYAKAGPATPKGASTFFTNLASNVSLYAHDNVYEPDLPVFSPRWHAPVESPMSHGFPAVTTTTAEDAYREVLARAGAWPRDAMNRRTVAEIRTATGRLGKTDDPLIATGRAPPPDADRDGMPDGWERRAGLDPSDPGDATGDRDGDGYSNVEEYLNQLARKVLAP